MFLLWAQKIPPMLKSATYNCALPKDHSTPNRSQSLVVTRPREGRKIKIVGFKEEEKSSPKRHGKGEGFEGEGGQHQRC